MLGCIVQRHPLNMAIFDEAVSEKQYSQKHSDNSNSNQNSWFPEEHNNQHQCCDGKGNDQIVLEDTNNTAGNSKKQSMFNESLTPFTTKDALNISAKFKEQTIQVCHLSTTSVSITGVQRVIEKGFFFIKFHFSLTICNLSIIFYDKLKIYAMYEQYLKNLSYLKKRLFSIF
jgi:hypothetical protein